MNDDMAKRYMTDDSDSGSVLWNSIVGMAVIVVLGLSFHGKIVSENHENGCKFSFSDSNPISYVHNIGVDLLTPPAPVVPVQVEMGEVMKTSYHALPLPPPVEPEAPMQPIKKLAGPYTGMVKIAAKHNKVPARLIASVLYVETRAKRGDVVSKAGAIGPMQIMPHTAWVVLRINPWKPMENIEGASRYIKRLIGRFGSIKKALIAYNEGPTQVDNGHIVPSARHYAEKVLKLARLTNNEKATLIYNASNEIQVADSQY